MLLMHDWNEGGKEEGRDSGKERGRKEERNKRREKGGNGVDKNEDKKVEGGVCGRSCKCDRVVTDVLGKGLLLSFTTLPAAVLVVSPMMTAVPKCYLQCKCSWCI